MSARFPRDVIHDNHRLLELLSLGLLLRNMNSLMVIVAPMMRKSVVIAPRIQPIT